MSHSLILPALICARQHGLGLSTLSTLLIIRDESVSLSSIANQLSLSTPAITGLADTLEVKLYATRKPAPYDRRRWILTITPLGLETLETILK